MAEDKICPKCCSNGPWQQITNGIRCAQCGFQEVELHPLQRKSEGYRGWTGEPKK